MVRNLVKKELYKQKPTAFFIGRGMATEAVVTGFSEKINSWEKAVEETGDSFYRAMLHLDGHDIDVHFKIPEEETFDEEGNRILNKEEPAQLLIRWLI